MRSHRDAGPGLANDAYDQIGAGSRFSGDVQRCTPTKEQMGTIEEPYRGRRIVAPEPPGLQHDARHAKDAIAHLARQMPA